MAESAPGAQNSLEDDPGRCCRWSRSRPATTRTPRPARRRRSRASCKLSPCPFVRGMGTFCPCAADTGWRGPCMAVQGVRPSWGENKARACTSCSSRTWESVLLLRHVHAGQAAEHAGGCGPSGRPWTGKNPLLAGRRALEIRWASAVSSTAVCWSSNRCPPRQCWRNCLLTPRRAGDRRLLARRDTRLPVWSRTTVCSSSSALLGAANALGYAFIEGDEGDPKVNCSS